MNRRILGAVLLLVLIGVGAGLYYLVSNLDKIVAEAIESNGSEVTSTEVGVSGVSISLREARGSIRGLSVGSPDGYRTREAFSLGDISIDLDPGSLRQDPVVLQEVRIQAPVVRAEFSEAGRSNLDELRKRIQEYAGPADGDAGAAGEAKRVRIDRFVFEEGQIEVDATDLGLEARTLNLPSIELTNVGGRAGATPDRIAREILGTLARQALEQIARSELEALIADQVGESLGEKVKGVLDRIGQ